MEQERFIVMVKNIIKGNLSRSQLIGIGFFLSIVGIFVLSVGFIHQKRDAIFQLKNVQFLQGNGEDEVVNVPGIEENSSNEVTPSATPTNTSRPSTASNTNNQNQYYFIGYLEIPKINLKNGFVDKKSKDNTVEKNITILSTAAYPDQAGGNFILAAHSGNGGIAYFNNLYKLSKGDTAIVTYKNKRYTYQFVDIYTQAKTGTAAIYRNMNKTVLTLITCTNNDNRKQTIYIAELIKTEDM